MQKSKERRTPLYYTFGNHMHWVDMQWLWGYNVLPSSVRDMLDFCQQAGVKGNVNFDAIGYEKMAAEAPEALAQLRQAVQASLIEVVGASYGQPYGLFHGGESNVRQRVYGVRTVRRLLGVSPHSFWEEEFDFFPQLPQLLRGVGYDYASLFFQWTWHTPVIPQEETSVIWWEGQDGSRLLTAPRNALNLHQWPEDLQGILDNPTLPAMNTPALVQWLELMPSPDWMCRAEVLLPPMRQLLDDPRFEIRPVTLAQLLQIAQANHPPASIPVRAYRMDEVFHGMSLGKNGDRMRRLSRQAEQSILTAESLSALSALGGRPYASLDVYPVWELEEAWRELLSAQHHDNDEREGLCGFVGLRSYERSLGLSSHVCQRTAQLLAQRAGDAVVYNPLGWQRAAVVNDHETDRLLCVRNLPPFGYRVLSEKDRLGIGSQNDVSVAPAVEMLEDEHTITLRRGALAVVVDRKRGAISQICSREFPQGALRADLPLAQLEMRRNDELETFDAVFITKDELSEQPFIEIGRQGRGELHVTIRVSLAPELDAVDVKYVARRLSRPDGRMHAALQTLLAVNLPNARLIHDHPYGVSPIDPQHSYLKKYPTGDWMTSPQVFEEVHNPFTALQLLDFDDGERGLLMLHDGSQAFLRDRGDPGIVRHILTLYDPWDESFFHNAFDVCVRFVPHAALTYAQRWKLAQEFTRPVLLVNAKQGATAPALQPSLPNHLGALWCSAENVAITAFYRESEWQGVPYPYVVRLVELNGETTQICLRLPGRIARAAKTNLLGEEAVELTPTSADSPLSGDAPWQVQWSELCFDMRSYEIATLYLDLEQGRKVTRDLDAHRTVWATLHKVDR